MNYFIQLVADYGVGDPAFGEVAQRLKHLLPQAQVFPTSVPAFSTLATGFWINQYALMAGPENFIIYSNTAPRKDTKQERKANEGEKFVFAQLNNGNQVAAVNSGYCLSFIKDQLKTFKTINISNKGSQFRSRDFYPQAVVGILKKKKGVLGQDLDQSLIPDLPSNRLAFVDGYGNLKTTIYQSEIKHKPGSKIKIKLNGVVRTAYFAHGNFEVKEGELAFAPGSSGKKEDRFLEIFLRGGSAHALFDHPRVESVISFDKIN
ncbi:MAG: hypothetical protein GF381_03005 [Candidatus Pacebacteria bacterium]|nr:hypothetical protein [Candidatus Paceibacterota bacterium]